MRTRVLSFSRNNRPQVLASVRIEFSFEGADDFIVVDDARVLRNRHGQLWLAMPSYSTPANGKGYDYFPAVTLSTKLKREVEDVVLPAYEDWQRQQPSAPGV